MFILGFLIGAVVTSVIFIIFGKNNKNKVNAARAQLLDIYHKVEPGVQAQIDKISIFKK